VDFSPDISEKLERLVAARIQMLPAAERHFVFERDGFVALVERLDDGFGNIGGAGVLWDKGFAALVHRADGAYFIAKGFEQRATEEQVSLLREFQEDLQRALSA
jgi:hypothetical protein